MTACDSDDALPRPNGLPNESRLIVISVVSTPLVPGDDLNALRRTGASTRNSLVAGHANVSQAD